MKRSESIHACKAKKWRNTSGAEWQEGSPGNSRCRDAEGRSYMKAAAPCASPALLTYVGVQEQRDAGRRKGGMRDDEVSGEEGSDNDEQEQNVASGSEDEDTFAEETVDETRLRLATDYLNKIKKETAAEEEDDDNFTFNQDAIAHRLQEGKRERQRKRGRQ